ncbi:MAG: cation diffusion facilitator family transporter [Planctomycetota bacterium]
MTQHSPHPCERNTSSTSSEKHANSCDHQHQHGHHHGLTSGDSYDSIPDSRLLWSVLLNQILTIGQIVAGVLSGSVSLLSDAAHNFSDANSLLIAYIARRISRRPASQQFTFGYHRAELIGATINLTLLAAVGAILVYEAMHRFFDPQPVIGWLMAAASGIALAVDLGTAALLWAMSRGSLNVRTAFVHNLVDAAGSLAVLLGAWIITTTGWTWVDPALTLLIAGYILWQVRSLLPQAVRILMECTPVDFPVESMIASVCQVNRVVGLHHIHVWQLDERHRALEAHVAIASNDAERLESIKSDVKQILEKDYQIHHSTLEFELVAPGSPSENSTTNSCQSGHPEKQHCWQHPEAIENEQADQRDRLGKA